MCEDLKKENMEFLKTNSEIESYDENEVTYVITRSNQKEPLDMNQITIRLQKLISRSPKIKNINPYNLMLKVVNATSPKFSSKIITTSEIDDECAHIAANLSLTNPYYLTLAGRIAVDNHQKNTKKGFYVKMKDAYNNKDEEGPFPLISEEFFNFIKKYCVELEEMIDYNRDFLLDYFGIKTFQKNYSLKINDKPIERPQDMFMREAIQVSRSPKNDSTKEEIQEILNEIKETYDLLSNKFYTHGSPTCYNSGGKREQLASCFLLGTGDSLEEIEQTGTNASHISKWAGGIGIHVHSWRSTGSRIKGTNGKSSGIVPFLKTYESRLQAFNQGGRRPGSGAIYLMPHHPDIMDFIDISRHIGDEKMRARDLFTAIWIPDIFMERVKSNQIWSLFDPKKCGDLSEYYGDEYTKKYLELENQKKYSKQINARIIWENIYALKQLRGFPYICFADHANKMSMHKNIGTIKSSNLCSEIYLYSDTKEYATCVLASIALPNFVLDSYTQEELKLPINQRRELNHEYPENPYFDYFKLKDVVKIVTRNLNNVVDKTYSPVIEAKRGNERHRPIGIGVQGLDDTFAKMRFPFESKEASQLNKYIFETIYYSALSKSCGMCRQEWIDLRKKCNQNGNISYTIFNPNNYDPQILNFSNSDDIPKKIAAYPSIDWNDGSPISKGIFHWELAGLKKEDLSGMWDWDSLREKIKIFGVKNSLLVALMPTASTSQLLGCNETIEPFTSNLYTRDTIAGQYIVIKKYLINDLFKSNLWNNDIRDMLMAEEGSIQNIGNIPQNIKYLYKTAYEIDQKVLVQQSIDRQPFVDQGQSLNLYLAPLTLTSFTNLMFQAWRGKLKTGNYYMHSKAAVMPQKFTIDPRLLQKISEEKEKSKNQTTENVISNKFKSIQSSDENDPHKQSNNVIQQIPTNFCDSCSG